MYEQSWPPKSSANSLIGFCLCLALGLGGCGSTSQEGADEDGPWSAHLAGRWDCSVRVDREKLAEGLDYTPSKTELDAIVSSVESGKFRLLFGKDGQLVYSVLEEDGTPGTEQPGSWKVVREEDRRVTVTLTPVDTSELASTLELEFVNPDIFQVHTGPKSAPRAIIQKYRRLQP